MTLVRKKRVVFIAPLPPPIHGSAMMSDYIRKSELINSEFNCRYVNMSTSRRMDEIGRGGVKKLFRFIGSYCRLLWLLLTFWPDCCHLAITCHGIGFLKDAPFVLLCKLFRRRIIIHQHNKGMAADVDRPIYKWLLPLVYRNATVVLLSWRLYPDIERVVSREQVRIIPNGIPAVTAERRKTANPIPQLLFLSNLIESKGVLTLLDACKLLKEQGYRFTCRFVGAETAEINRTRFDREVASRGLNETVSFAGPRYGVDKESELSGSDAFVFPTKEDCFPLVLLEAMQHYLPVVATDQGGIADIVENGISGLISEAKATDLATKIKGLLDNPTYRRQLGENGYRRFMQLFTVRKYEDSISDMLRYVIGGG